jgi:hypothetical protein
MSRGGLYIKDHNLEGRCKPFAQGKRPSTETASKSQRKMPLGQIALIKPVPLDSLEQIGNTRRFGSRGKRTRFGARTMDSDQKSAWLRKLDEECPYQVVLPRRQLADDSAILDFLIAHVEKFDMYVEDDYAAFVRYCFADPLDAEIFRSRFEPKAERFKLAG